MITTPQFKNPADEEVSEIRMLEAEEADLEVDVSKGTNPSALEISVSSSLLSTARRTRGARKKKPIEPFNPHQYEEEKEAEQI